MTIALLSLSAMICTLRDTTRFSAEPGAPGTGAGTATPGTGVGVAGRGVSDVGLAAVPTVTGVCPGATVGAVVCCERPVIACCRIGASLSERAFCRW